MIDFFGHIGYVALILGTWLLGKKHIAGWIFRGIGSGIWLVLGIATAMSSIWIWSSIFIVMDALGFYRWKVKHEKNN